MTDCLEGAVNYCLVSGDHESIDLFFSTPGPADPVTGIATQVAVNIDGYSIRYVLQRETDVIPVLVKTTENGGIAIRDQAVPTTKGYARVNILPLDTGPYDDVSFRWEAQGIDPAGTVKTPRYHFGTARVRRDYA